MIGLIQYKISCWIGGWRSMPGRERSMSGERRGSSDAAPSCLGQGSGFVRAALSTEDRCGKKRRRGKASRDARAGVGLAKGKLELEGISCRKRLRAAEGGVLRAVEHAEPGGMRHVNGDAQNPAEEEEWAGAEAVRERVRRYVQRELVSQNPVAADWSSDSDGDEVVEEAIEGGGALKPGQGRSYGGAWPRWTKADPRTFRNAMYWPAPGCSTVQTHIQVCKNNVAVTLTREAAVVDEWVRKQKGSHFGLDAEWKPNHQKGAPDNKLAVLQISAAGECLIVQMLFLDSMPQALVAFLEDPEKKLGGVGITGDTSKLQRDYGVRCQGEVELTSLAAACWKTQEVKNIGLKKLARKVINFDMAKPKKVTMSNWAKRVLDPPQLRYACVDAWVSFAIFNALLQRQSKATKAGTPASE